MTSTARSLAIGAIVCVLSSSIQAEPAKPKPIMRDFMGLNVHTVLFKPGLYLPVTRKLRDYHPMEWDVNENPSQETLYPMSRNGVNWLDLYGGWKKMGYQIDACAMFDPIALDKWKDVERDGFRVGESFAKFFGPSGENRLIESVELGNEPSKYDSASYRNLFKPLAEGIRQGDPKLKIATCAVIVGKGDTYSKSIDAVKGLESLYDIINVHTYAFVEGWPTWRRSYPEDGSIAYLKDLTNMIAWRNANAKGKQIWVTEFGWDATTKPNKTTGDFAKWVGNSEAEQARYIVRSYLVFSAMDIDRAYLYWFNDNDEPQLHGSSGLTRNYVPKPAFHAVAHLYQTLGDCRFVRKVVEEANGTYAYEYVTTSGPQRRVWAVWSATGSGKQGTVTLPAPKGELLRAEKMPLAAGGATEAKVSVATSGQLSLAIDEAPTYIWIK